jgi:hypothetical protein
MTPRLGEIDTTKIMIASVTQLSQVYLLCKEFNGITCQPLEDLNAYKVKLEKRLAKLKRQ